MAKITGDQIEIAIGRLPSQSNVEIRRVLENAKRLGIGRLIEACDTELKTRGSVELDTAQAIKAHEQARASQGKPLREVIRVAFSAIPASDYEIRLLNIIARMSGEQCARIEAAYGKRDSSLALGHLVYDRFGFFRQFLSEEKDQSSILVEKGKKDGLVTWKLKPETETELRMMNVIRDDYTFK